MTDFCTEQRTCKVSETTSHWSFVAELLLLFTLWHQMIRRVLCFAVFALVSVTLYKSAMSMPEWVIIRWVWTMENTFEVLSLEKTALLTEHGRKCTPACSYLASRQSFRFFGEERETRKVVLNDLVNLAISRILVPRISHPPALLERERRPRASLLRTSGSDPL